MLGSEPSAVLAARDVAELEAIAALPTWRQPLFERFMLRPRSRCSTSCPGARR